MAATGTVNISGANQVVNGNKVTVTVTISSSTKIGSWQMNLNYDKNYLKLTSSTAENGTTMANAAKTDAGVSKQTYTFTFKASNLSSNNSTDFTIAGELFTFPYLLYKPAFEDLRYFTKSGSTSKSSARFISAAISSAVGFLIFFSINSLIKHAFSTGFFSVTHTFIPFE